MNSLYVDGDRHSSILNEDCDRVPVTFGIEDQAAREVDGLCLGTAAFRRRGGFGRVTANKNFAEFRPVAVPMEE